MDSNLRFADWLKFKTCADPELVKLVKACQEWATAFKNGEEPRWLSILGVSGTGKTHCARRLFFWANGKAEHGRSIQREGFSYYDGLEYIPHEIYWPDFVQLLKSGHGFSKRDDMKKWPVLFLDDIGAERDPSGFAAEELNTLLGMRVGKWTLITSNKDGEALKAVDGRISSRLIRGKNICVGLNTQDFSER